MSRNLAVRRIVRMSIVLSSLVAIVGFSLALIAFVPNYGFVLHWTPAGELQVVSTLPDHPASNYLSPGDRVIAIDGRPIFRSPWRFLFAPGHTAYTYTLEREGVTLEATVPVQALRGDIVRWRLIPGLISLGAWLVGVGILLLASPRNRDGWQVGLTTIGLAVVLAVSEAAIYSIPVAWLISDPFLAFMTVAFAQLALIPGKGKASNLSCWSFRLLYGFAALLGLAEVVDMLFLIPQGISVSALTGIDLYDWILLTCAFGLLLNPAILLARYLHLQPSLQRQQVYLLLVLTALAVSPLCLLVILPRVVTGTPLIPWEVGFVLLILLPLAYGYVVYRRNFLNLDL